MTVEEAIDATPHLRGKARAGLGALRPEDKPHIKAEDTRALTVSVDVDAALVVKEPQANRWDFAIGYRHTNRAEESIYWVELHTASDSQVSKVLAKLRWLKTWLRGDGRQLAGFERDFVWISSGATTFTLTGPKMKQFAQMGLRHSGKVLRIPKERK